HSFFDCTLLAGPVAQSATGMGRRSAGLSRLCLRNMVPAPFLGPRFEAAHSTVLFSATIGPHDYFADLLGLPENTRWLEVESPFRPEQLEVCIARHVSTRF